MNSGKNKIKKPLYRRIIKITLIIVASFVGLILILALLIQSSPVQNFIKNKAVSYLKAKLHTELSIGKIYITFPKNIVINDIYLEDHAHDTLFSAEKLSVNLSMLKLLHSNIEINSIDLEKSTIHVKRLLPDTIFNFQFIVDAFASPTTKPMAQKDSSSSQISVHDIVLDKINLVFKDAVSGNDDSFFLGHLAINIDRFDMAHQDFSVPSVVVTDLHGKIRQTAALVRGNPKHDTTKFIYPSLKLRNISLNEIQLVYLDNPTAVNANLKVHNLAVHVRAMDLTNHLIQLDHVELSKTSVAVGLGKLDHSKATQANSSEPIAADSPNWRIIADRLDLTESNISFDDENKAAQKSGLDYSHMHLRDIMLHANHLLYSRDTMAADISAASLLESSNFQLGELSGEILYSDKRAYVKNLLVKTPSSVVQGSVDLLYPSLDAIKKDPRSLTLRANLGQCSLQAKDILAFVPGLKKQAAFHNTDEIFKFKTTVSGNLASLNLNLFQFSGFDGSQIDVTGTIKGLPEIKNLYGDFVINKINTTKKDLTLLLPPHSLPSTLEIPETISLHGNVKGSEQFLIADLTMNSSSGFLSIKGSTRKMSDIKNMVYNATVIAKDFQAGKVLKSESSYGSVSLQFMARGRGLDVHTAQSEFEGTIYSAEIKKYKYQNLRIKGSLQNEIAQTDIVMHDPNMDFSLHGMADWHSKYPSVHITTSVADLKTQPLGFSSRNIGYSGYIDINFPVTDPDNLKGEALFAKNIITSDSQKIAIDTVKLLAGQTDTNQFIRLYADVIEAQMQGKYKLTEMRSVLKQLFNPYFQTMNADSVVNTSQYDFSITAVIKNRPLLRTLIPSLTRLDPIQFAAHFNTEKGWKADLISPMIVFGSNRIKNFQVHVKPQSKSLIVDAEIAQLNSGKSLALYGVSLKNSITDNKINFVLNIEDKFLKNRYTIGGLFEQPNKKDYKLSLNGESLLLNYQSWQVDKNNSIHFSSGDINAVAFNLKKNDEELRINSASSQKDAPLNIEFNNFLLSTLSSMAGSDSLALNGRLNGKATVTNIRNAPIFVGQLAINDLSFNSDTLGNLSIKVNNETQNKFSADVHIDGRGNDISLTGDYSTGNGTFDLNAKINKLELSSIVGASMGILKKASGSIQGDLALKGTLNKPDISGNIFFTDAMITPTDLNNDFYISNENLKIDHGITFKNFAILDSAKNKLVFDGPVKTEDYKHFDFNLSVNAKNFRALNTEKSDNQLYYGKLYFNCNLQVKGTELKPVVDGTVKIDEKTNLTITLPQDEPGIEDRQGVVEFVNKKSLINDSVKNAENKDTSNFVVRGIDISTNIIIDSSAILNIIIDPDNGDALSVKGKATLTGGADQSGKTTLSGTYQISNGSYNLSFSLLKKNFKIQNGSTIVWTGEPTKANLNINAILIANTAPIDLVDDQLAQSTSSVRNTYLQKLPFEVHLHIGGELMKPQVSFDIVLPEDQSYSVSKDIITLVQGKLGMLRQDSGELNKQVFALLLLNRFVGDDPFASDAAGINAESLARSSVSKILTQQLNQLASSLIKGVDVNFDLQSSDDYTTGQLQNRTDLNVMVSKRLLNDRLTVSVGSDFELEGPQNVGASQGSDLIGNVGINYKLTKDGRYMLRAYRKNDYDDIVEGYVVETGVGFIITVDYNKFSELFSKKKKSKE